MLLPVAGRTPRIAHHHGVTGAGVHLGLVEQRRRIGGVRTAVHDQQHRVRTGACGRDQPAVHRIAVRCAVVVNSTAGRIPTSDSDRPKSDSCRSPLPDPSASRSTVTSSPAEFAGRHHHGDRSVPGVERAHHPRPPTTTGSSASATAVTGHRHRHQRGRAPVQHADQHPIVQHDGRSGGPVDVDGVRIGQPPRRPAGQRHRPQPGGPAGRIDAGEFDADVTDLGAEHGQQRSRAADRDHPLVDRFRAFRVGVVGHSSDFGHGSDIGHGDDDELVGQFVHAGGAAVDQLVRSGEGRVDGAGRLLGQLHRLPRFVTRGSTREVQHEDLFRLVPDEPLAVQPVATIW